MTQNAEVASVSAAATHSFSKAVLPAIVLMAGYGVEGDAHAGPFVKHRYLARWRPKLPNERQVHLLESELLDELREEGFVIMPGQLGENVTSCGVNLRRLLLGTQLSIGSDSV